MSILTATVPRWAPPTDKPHVLYEFVKGEWKETPRMGAFASLLASFLDKRIGWFAEQNNRGLSMTETLFVLGPDRLSRRPNLAFVSFQRWPYNQPFEEDPPAFEVVPELTVEVISPSNTALEVLDKIREYFTAGVERVWVVYPNHRQVYVYTSPVDVRILDEQGELDGERILPGFRLPLSQLFAVGTLPS